MAVAIVKGDDAKYLVRRSLALLGGMNNYVKNGNNVFIKPNMTGPYLSKTGATTDPEIVSELIKMCFEQGAKSVKVGDIPGVGSSKEVFEVTGMKRAVEKVGGEVVELDKSELVEIKVPNAEILKVIHLPKPVVESDVYISVPKLKTHILANTKCSLGMKNNMGLLPDSVRRKYHRYENVSRIVCDSLRARMPNLVVVDGIIGGEGQGPLATDPVNIGVVVAGEIFETEMVCAKIMGLEPNDTEMVKTGRATGFHIPSLSHIEIRGLPISEVKREFKLPRVGLDYPNVTVYSGGDCTECLEFIQVYMDVWHKKGLLDEIGPITLISGSRIPVSEATEFKGPVFVLGECTPASFRKRGYYVKGCPTFAEDFKEQLSIYLSRHSLGGVGKLG
ncbi:MAG: DUF362 domain-containing protein [Thermoplasmata archaeon]